MCLGGGMYFFFRAKTSQRIPCKGGCCWRLAEAQHMKHMQLHPVCSVTFTSLRCRKGLAETPISGALPIFEISKNAIQYQQVSLALQSFPSKTASPSAILMFPGAEFGFLSLPLGEGSHRIPGINNSSRIDSVAAPDDTISLGHSGIAASGTAVAIKSKKLVLVRGQLPLGRICPFLLLSICFFPNRVHFSRCFSVKVPWVTMASLP